MVEDKVALIDKIEIISSENKGLTEEINSILKSREITKILSEVFTSFVIHCYNDFHSPHHAKEIIQYLQDENFDKKKMIEELNV